METKKAIKILRELTTQDNFLAIEGIIKLLKENKERHRTIEELKEIEEEFSQHNPLLENTMDNEDAININLFMEEVIEVFEKIEQRLKKVERLADDNWRSLEYIMGFYEEHSKRFAADSVDTYNGKPISEIKVGGTI